MSITEKTSRNTIASVVISNHLCYVKRNAVKKHLKGKMLNLQKRYNCHNNMFFSVGFNSDVKIILNFDYASVFIKKVTLLNFNI
jgi:hypothetical protein